MDIKKTVLVVIISLFIVSCGSDVEDILPKMKNGIEVISKDISSEIAFSELAFRSTRNESTGERTSRNLNIVLTDAEIKLLNKKDLELLSSRISSIVKQNVINIDTYDWINIVYETRDGSQASDSTEKNTYVFRPSEIK